MQMTLNHFQITPLKPLIQRRCRNPLHCRELQYFTTCVDTNALTGRGSPKQCVAPTTSSIPLQPVLEDLAALIIPVISEVFFQSQQLIVLREAFAAGD
ncbi:MAG: hypothetical protein JWN70_2652, partial [Planctomycetaceae bacterium]|nr:hypothetical protein [Planctomycetaceae bacterium]